MGKRSVSVLSQTDFNGKEMPDSLFQRTFGELIDEYGYVNIKNVSESFDHVAFCARLGRSVPNYVGALVGDIRPEPGMEEIYHVGNMRGMLPHTEGYDFQVHPPRYIALWCVVPCRGGGGETTLADAYEFLSTLPDEQINLLRDTVYEWGTTEGARRLGVDLHTKYPVIEDVGDRRIVRFSCNSIVRDEADPLADIQARVQAFFDARAVVVDYAANDMLVWDNWRMLHSRTPFSDKSRHLRRIQIAAPAQSLSAAPPSGS